MSRTSPNGRKAKPKPQPRDFVEPLDEPSLAKRFIVIETKFRFSDLPLHPLAIPSGWARRSEGDVPFSECDLETRERSIGRAANWNRAMMREHADVSLESPEDFLWALVFEIGEFEEGSFLSIQGGCSAQLSVETTVTLVRPTPEEIERVAPSDEPVLCRCAAEGTVTHG